MKTTLILLAVGQAAAVATQNWPLDPLKVPPTKHEVDWDYAPTENWIDGQDVRPVQIASEALRISPGGKKSRFQLSDYKVAVVDRGTIYHVHFQKIRPADKTPVAPGQGRAQMGGGVVVIIDKKVMKAKYILSTG